ncbi:hypothetical protein [Sphingomonas sp. 22176]|uniref:hypothetical protein n=1 Tax=Sphingomonas sp. 22176 TaxID=3453884 RepID=UPI003F849B80
MQRALQSAFIGFLDLMAPLDKGGRFRAALAAAAEKGAPLMIGDAKTVQLVAIDFAPIAPTRFAIPDDLASAEELRSIAREIEEKQIEEKKLRGARL